jgi:hypothetical protein
MSKSFRLSSGAWLLMSLVAACQGAEQGRSSGTEVEGTEPERSEPENPAHEDGGPEGLPPVVGACQESSDCQGDANCEVCLEEGACADGHVLWVVGAPTLQEGCICTPTEPGDPTCQYEWCCSGQNPVWSPEACDCVPADGDELPPVVGACQESSDCQGDANCEACLEEGTCAEGHVLWVVGAPTPQEGCICTPTEPGDPTCQYEWCCPDDQEWNAEACDCVPCDPASGTH